MKLIFLLQRNSWFVEKDGNWSALSDKQSVNLALTALPVKCVDEFDLSEQPLQQGHAEVETISDDTVKFTIRSPDQTVLSEDQIKLDPACLSHIEWDETPEGDGWIKSIARLNTENVRRLSLKAFIPPVDAQDGKSLHVLNESTGEEKTLFLQRGQENELLVVDGAVAADHKLVLRCDAEAANDSADVRSLGFVLLDKVIEN